MIVIKIERWPDDADPDDPRERRHRTDIARAVIRNDHSGSPESGNYHATLYDPPAYNPWAGRTLETTISGFRRHELGVWDLLYRVLRDLVGERNEQEASEREQQQEEQRPET